MAVLDAEGLDLDLTLYPSFLLALMDGGGGRYLKLYGYSKGSRLELSKGKLYCNCPEDVAKYLSGLWYDPWNAASKVPSDYYDRVRPLLELYGERLRLAVSPFDRPLIFAVVFMSRNTDFHANVLRWARRLFSRTDDPYEISELEDVSWVGTSYQVRELPSALREYLALKRRDPLDERRALLSIRGVGVKTADAYLLFTGNPRAAPIDKHFLRFSRRFEVAVGRPPRKDYCMRFDCAMCPMRENCISHFVVEKYGELAGWLQTVAYVHDKVYCARGLCSRCPLSRCCKVRAV